MGGCLDYTFGQMKIIPFILEISFYVSHGKIQQTEENILWYKNNIPDICIFYR